MARNHLVYAESVVAAIGAARHGIVPAALAAASGVAEWSLKHLRRRGVLVSVGRGVDRLRDHPDDWASRCRAALDLAGEGAVLGLRTAARLHRLYRYRDCEDIEVIVLRHGDHRTPLGRVVETNWLPADHVTVIDGFPVTTLARTFFDLCGDPDGGRSVNHPAHEKAMVHVYNDALARRGLTFTQEAAVLLVMARRGRAGTRLVRKILLRFGRDHVPTQSDTETLFAELVTSYGLPEPQRQVALSDEHGWIGTVDFFWPEYRLVVEIDSTWHDGPLDRLEDAERDARLRAAGYTVLRLRYGDLVGRPAWVARKLAAVASSMGDVTAADS